MVVEIESKTDFQNTDRAGRVQNMSVRSAGPRWHFAQFESISALQNHLASLLLQYTSMVTNLIDYTGKLSEWHLYVTESMSQLFYTFGSVT